MTNHVLLSRGLVPRYVITTPLNRQLFFRAYLRHSGSCHYFHCLFCPEDLQRMHLSIRYIGTSFMWKLYTFSCILYKICLYHLSHRHSYLCGYVRQGNSRYTTEFTHILCSIRPLPSCRELWHSTFHIWEWHPFVQ